MKTNIHIQSADKILADMKLKTDGAAQRFFVHETQKIMDPYVPMLTGSLKNTAVEGADRITYIMPYARKQYYGNKGRGLRGKLWDKRAWSDRGREVTVSVAKFIGGKPV